MRYRKTAALAAVCFLIAGCAGSIGDYVSNQAPATQASATPLPATKMPRYSDALAGLYAAPASKLPRDVAINYDAPGGAAGKPGRAVLTMALVPGANYQKLKAYLAQAAIDTGAQRDLALEPVLQQAVDIVKQRYPWIELTNDLATARKRNTSLTLVLDIRARLAKKGGDKTAVQIEVVAFNDQHKPIARYLCEGTAFAGNANAPFSFAAAAHQALAELTQKSNSYFN